MLRTTTLKILLTLCTVFIGFNLNAASITLTASGFWNNTAIWPGGVLPTEDDDVIVPMGQRLVMLGRCRAKSITVMGTLDAVNWQEGGAWIDLRTKYIMVMGPNARLEIGNETQPYQSGRGCVITLTGTTPGEKIPGTDIDSKSIMVMNGAKLNLHGTSKKSWVKIGAKTAEGSTSIQLAEAIDWKIGDEIVITSNRVDPYEAETRIITGISADFRTVSFDEALVYPRNGELNTYSNDSRSWAVDTRAEVGVLSRNIKIQGDDSADSTGYGGHIMIMSNSVGNADNIELHRMGQKAVLGRYPWHWHLLASGGEGQYLTNSSIHRSFNRAVTIHGTWGTLVDQNVAYDHVGHGIFLEDGSEINNTISNNLVLLTKNAASREEALLNTDFGLNALQNASPSSFWITNPDNTFRNNIVAGSEGTAYWYAMPDAPTGFSESDPDLGNLRPRQTDLKEFSGNVAHSCLTAFDINDRLDANHALKANGGISAPNPFVIQDFTAFSNRLALYSGIGDKEEDIIFDNCMSSDNELHTMFASRTVVRNSIFIADTDNGLLDKRVLNLPNIRLYQLYDGAGRVYDSHLVNWNRDNTTLFGNNGAAQKRINHLFRGLSYNHQGPARIEMPTAQPLGDVAGRCPQVWSNVVRDLDGSLTRQGTPNSVVNDIKFHDIDNVFQPENWNGLQSISNKFVYMYFANQPLRVTRKDVTCNALKQFETAKCELGGVVQLHLALDEGKYEHSIYCDNLTGSILDININSELREGDALTVRYKGFGNLADVGINGIEPKATINEVIAATETAYFVEPSGDLYVKFITTSSFKGKRYRIQWSSGTLPDMTIANEEVDVLNVSMKAIHPCDGDGGITFNFNDNPNQSTIEFSVDGGITYPYSANDNEGSTSISGLTVGPYNVHARWAGSSCSNFVGVMELEKSSYICRKWEFNVDGDYDQWATNSQLITSVENGVINYEITGGDPVMASSTGISAEAIEYPFVRVRLKTVADGRIEVFWGGGSFARTRYKSFDVTASPDFQEVLIPMDENLAWSGIIDRLRIDLQFPRGQVGAVDLISLEKEDLRDCLGTWEGTAQLEDCVVSVNEFETQDQELAIFPNPVEDHLTILNLKEGVSWKLIDELGIELRSGTSSFMNLKTLKDGVYFLQFSTGKVTRFVK